MYYVIKLTFISLHKCMKAFSEYIVAQIRFSVWIYCHIKLLLWYFSELDSVCLSWWKTAL